MTVLIACPKCHTELRLRDRRRLGQTGKCPKCEHRFVLQEAPDEVELELAEQPARGDAAAPAVGRAARWVPDQPVQPQQIPTQTVAVHDPAPAVVASPLGQFASEPMDAVKRLKLKRKQARRRNLIGTIATLTVLIGLGGAYFAFRDQFGAPAQKITKVKPDQTDVVAGTSADDPPEPATRSGKPQAEPIELLYVPSGARIIANLRPAELWKAGGLGEGEFKACLGPLGVWLEESLKTLCYADPANIEEALVCIIPGARGSPPDISVVVHLKQDAKKSELIEKFAGERMDDLGRVYYATETKAFLLQDLRTYAISPRSMASEMVRAAEYSNPTDPDIEELLPHTNRQRMFSLVFVPQDIKLHEEVLIPEPLRPFVRRVVEWVSQDDEVGGVAWSLQLGEKFHSELLLRNTRGVKLHQLQTALAEKLETTPREILQTIEYMNPPEVGKRRVIGRVPAMSKAFALSTRIEREDRHLALITELPERAGPNLALGTLLAWDESTRTNFAKEYPTPGKGQGGAKVPERIADRFKTKIDVDFRREPLFSAFEYIATEAKFDVTIDGDALKLSGYTKNMPQTFKMDQAPAGKALQEILKAYDQMVIIVDEKKKTVTVTTVKAAEAKGLKPFEFPK